MSFSQPALHVIPFPNTPDASAESEIIFSSLRPSDLAGEPVVTGSSSGVHDGHLVLLPDDAGTEFLLAQPFTPGEKVAVRALLNSSQAGTASGDFGSRSLTWSFTIASPPPSATPTTSPAAAHAHGSSGGHRTFQSEPDLQPPPVHVSEGPAPGPEDIFASPRSQALFAPTSQPSDAQSGPMILSPRGQLLWFDPLGGNLVAFNLEVQTYHGRPVLTWWQGYPGEVGQDVVMSASYRRVAVLGTAWGYRPDLHEFQITPQGTALRAVTVTVKANLSSIGGPVSGLVVDHVIQEVDIHTGQVLWEWHALGHVPLTAAYSPRDRTPFDAYHLNSIQQLPGHKLLISLRSTWAVYEIDELTGRVIWTLGGKRSSFRMGSGTAFEWQHDAHLYPHGLLTLFDDAWAQVAPPAEPQSSAKELRVDMSNRTVSLVHTYRHSPPLLAGAEGSAQLLNKGDVFVGWGTEPVFSQYAPGGRQIFSASFPPGVASYRAYRFVWTGHPLTPPSLAVSRGQDGVARLYASWNGATAVASWRVLAGSSPQHLKSLAVKRWTGFETAILVRSTARYIAVQALSATGDVLARSALK